MGRIDECVDGPNPMGHMSMDVGGWGDVSRPGCQKNTKKKKNRKEEEKEEEEEE